MNTAMNMKRILGSVVAALVMTSGAVASEIATQSGLRAGLAVDILYGPKQEQSYGWSKARVVNAQTVVSTPDTSRGHFKWSSTKTQEVHTPRSNNSVATAKQSAYKWGIRSTADQSAYKWGIRSTADQSAYKWGIRSTADQSAYKWGIRSTADQSAYKWGIR